VIVFSLGALDIVFRTGNVGPPNVGLVLTDPGGRRIGFDPITKRAWQALPVAQGDINCDDLGRTNTCWGIVQVCGPISGTYKLEVTLGQRNIHELNPNRCSLHCLFLLT
jgi:hypothetical protein